MGLFILLTGIAFFDSIVNVDYYGQYNWVLLPLAAAYAFGIILVKGQLRLSIARCIAYSIAIVVLWTIPTLNWREAIRLIADVLLFWSLFEISSSSPNSNRTISYFATLAVGLGLILAGVQLTDGNERITGFIPGSPTTFGLANLVICLWPQQLLRKTSLDIAIRLTAGGLALMTKTTGVTLLLFLVLLVRFVNKTLSFLCRKWRSSNRKWSSELIADRLVLHRTRKIEKVILLCILFCCFVTTYLLTRLMDLPLLNVFTTLQDKNTLFSYYGIVRESWYWSVTTRLNIYGALLSEQSWVTWIFGRGVGAAYARTIDNMGPGVVPHWDLLVLLYDFGLVGFVILSYVSLSTLWPILAMNQERWKILLILVLLLLGTFYNLIYVPFLVGLLAIALGVACQNGRHKVTT